MDLASLTPAQQAAATHFEGPALVVAGPGSGKTRVITHRIAHLIGAHGVPPWEILAITFTNKAAEEMRQRLAKMLTERQARAVTAATFHAFCAKLLRLHGAHLGLPPGFSIWDTDDQKRAMKKALETLRMDPKNYAPAAMLAAVSKAKNDLCDAEKYASNAAGFHDKKIAAVYAEYEKILAAAHALDFDDLLVKVVRLLQRHPQVRQALSARYRFILVDEYQDTNRVQFTLARLLAEAHGNLMATGDPDQSIYAWRGADIRNILDFEAAFPGAKVYRLEQNYRSFGHILKCADGLIRHNQGRKAKELFTDRGDGEPVLLATANDERGEAQLTVARLRELAAERNIPWSECAVFYRVSALSRPLEEALRHAGIPYRVARGTAFFDREEIRNALAYLRAIANPLDDMSLARIVNTPSRGISSATVDALTAGGRNLGAALADPRLRGTLNARAAKAVAAFAQQMGAWRGTAGGQELTGRDDAEVPASLHIPSLSEFVEQVLREAGLEDMYGRQDEAPDEERLANLSELVNSAHEYEQDLEGGAANPLGEPDPFGDLEQGGPAARPPGPPSLAQKLMGFLERVSLVADADTVDSSAGAVTLMTLHAAKGLEFDAVGIVGLEDGLLPHRRATEAAAFKPEGLEEERRLLFVGITRARKHLILTRAGNRTVFGQSGPTIPSRFLRELPAGSLAGATGTRLMTADAEEAPELPPEDDAGLQPGQRVRHRDFGLGTVAGVTPGSGHTRVTVDFDRYGRKTMIAEYAHLAVL